MLTKREKEVLEAIVKYIEENEYVPSVREICEVIGLKSTSTAHSHLKSLESKGYMPLGWVRFPCTPAIEN